MQKQHHFGYLCWIWSIFADHLHPIWLFVFIFLMQKLFSFTMSTTYSNAPYLIVHKVIKPLVLIRIGIHTVYSVKLIAHAFRNTMHKH